MGDGDDFHENREGTDGVLSWTHIPGSSTVLFGVGKYLEQREKSGMRPGLY